ncbi:ESPR domain-containing protein, partial [Burkholderia ubonensis]|uniref:ESPR domain-containing protein n=1 Tax=Burkholderia ubonensis TaxID=101571 RepID=UPI0012F9E955
MRGRHLQTAGSRIDGVRPRRNGQRCCPFHPSGMQYAARFPLSSRVSHAGMRRCVNREETRTMNKTYALVWNQTQRCWNAVGETARRRGKSSGGKRVAAAAVSLL